jgi:hypothetical protein
MAEIYSAQSGKPDYSSYVEYMENLGWRRSQITLDENNARIVTTTGAAVNTTTAIVDVRCPAGQKISIMGTQQIQRGADARTAHSLRIRFAGTNDVEVSQLTKIRITKEKTTEDIVQLARVFYNDVSMIKQLGAITAGLGSVAQYKDDSIWYRFKQGIELNGEEHLFVYVVAENPTGGPNLPDIAIERTHVKFALDCDMWTS